jgi:hypothetical protein
MTRIAVPLEEMQQLAGVWQHTITEMDAMIQQVAREIGAIPDKAKGLNDVRSQGQKVGAQHREFTARGMDVHRHVIDSVQRFMQTEQELTRMMQNGGSTSVLSLVQSMGGTLQLANLIGHNNFATDSGQPVDYTTYALRATKWFIKLASLKGWILESGGKLASHILVYANIIKDIGNGLESGFVRGDTDEALHHFAGAAAVAQMAYISSTGVGAVGVGLFQSFSWGLGFAQEKLQNTAGFEVYAKTIEPIRQITDIKGILTEVNKAFWLHRQRDLMQGGWDGFVNGISRDWTDFKSSVENKAHEMYQNQVEARNRTIELVANHPLVKNHYTQEQVEKMADVYTTISPFFSGILPGVGIINTVLGL